MRYTANHYEYSIPIKLKWERTLRDSEFESEKTTRREEKELQRKIINLILQKNAGNIK